MRKFDRIGARLDRGLGEIISALTTRDGDERVRELERISRDPAHPTEIRERAARLAKEGITATTPGAVSSAPES